jgi:hypothetical protein
MEEMTYWPWNIEDPWVPKRQFSAKCREKIDKAAFVTAEIACGTWDFGDQSVPMHRDHTRRIPIPVVMEAAGWSVKSSQCRNYLKSKYFVDKLNKEMQRREVGYVGELAKLGEELDTKGVSFLKSLGANALAVLFERLENEHTKHKFSNRDLLAVAQFGLTMDAKINAATTTRDNHTPLPGGVTIRADVMQVMSPDDPRLDKLRRDIIDAEDAVEVED